MPNYDLGEITNPRRRLARQEAEAGLSGTVPMPAAGASAPAGAMSQSQFGGPAETPQQKLAKQKKLAEILRNRQ